MKLIKKTDNNGNEYYEEILETKEEMIENIDNTIKSRKKKKTKYIITLLLSLAIIIIFGLMALGKINIFDEKYRLLEMIIVMIGIAGLEESARKLK